MDFLCALSGGNVPLATYAAGHAAAVPHVGLPRCAGIVCAQCARADCQYLDGAAGAVVHRAAANFVRAFLLPPLAREDGAGFNACLTKFPAMRPSRAEVSRRF